MQDIFGTLVQFGVAGLMGVLWVWERMHSRKREQQLTRAHELLSRRDQSVSVLVRLVRHNTRTMVNFERTQQRMCDVLEGIRHEISNHQKTM